VGAGGGELGGGGEERERDLCGLGGVPQNAQLSTNYNISGSSPMITYFINPLCETQV
jgi:hypothetical protein